MQSLGASKQQRLEQPCYCTAPHTQVVVFFLLYVCHNHHRRHLLPSLAPVCRAPSSYRPASHRRAGRWAP